MRGAWSGAVLSEVPRRMFPKRDMAAKLGARFPPVFFSTDELRDVRDVKDPGAGPAHEALLQSMPCSGEHEGPMETHARGGSKAQRGFRECCTFRATQESSACGALAK